MCGICGTTADAALDRVHAMNAMMVRRGPDDGGVHWDSISGIALGARRLSIIDVLGGHQPVGNEDGTVWAVLNGEIYNHPELQARLRRRGHTLGSTTDTEVLAHLYEDRGDGLVDDLEGMFAFAILDTRRRRLLIARDRFGEKPLFYTVRGGTLTFASELDTLLTGARLPLELDPTSVDEYFVLGYVDAPRSMVPNVHQLPAAHALSWDARERLPRLHRYWTPSTQPRRTPGESERDLVSETVRLLKSSVHSRMRSDVPLGVLLSGGLDSTLLAAIAAEASDGPLKTFTVGYDLGDVNELDDAKATAAMLGTEHHALVVSAAELGQRAPQVLRALDQPLADPALVALQAIAEFARQEVTVAVGGEGADELFAGYPRYRWLQRAEALNARVPSSVRHAGASVLDRTRSPRTRRLADILRPQPVADLHLDWVTERRRHARSDLYGPALRDHVDLDRVLFGVRSSIGQAQNGSLPGAFMRHDQRSWLQGDVLAKADRASMQVSLELRTPYLHRELAEFAGTVAPSVHLAGGGKYLLREALRQVAPQVQRRAKRAFGVPRAEWLRGPLRDSLSEQLRDSHLYAEGIFDQERVSERVERHLAGTADESAVLWPLFVLGHWLDARRPA